jgi:hypothetical protein
MHRRSLLASLAAAPMAARAAAAAPAPVLIELFTSQGCNSCPRADAALARLAARHDVLPLAFHVTYWDRLGWTDTLGDARFDRRQRWYAGLLGTGAYTPQAVVAGELDLVGSDPRLERALALVAERRMPAPVAIGADAVAALPEVEATAPLALTALAFDPHHRVAIGRGENAGREIDYVNAVRSIADLGTWDGTPRQVSLGAVAAGGRGLVLLAQDPATGRIAALGHRAA